MNRKEKIVNCSVIVAIIIGIISVALLNWYSLETRRNTVKCEFGIFEEYWNLFGTGGDATLEGYTMSVTTINGSQPWIHTVFYATHEEQESTNATTIRVRDETDYKWWVNWQEKKVYWTYTYDLLGCRHTIDVEEIT